MSHHTHCITRKRTDDTFALVESAFRSVSLPLQETNEFHSDYGWEARGEPGQITRLLCTVSYRPEEGYPDERLSVRLVHGNERVLELVFKARQNIWIVQSSLTGGSLLAEEALDAFFVLGRITSDHPVEIGTLEALDLARRMAGFYLKLIQRSDSPR